MRKKGDKRKRIQPVIETEAIVAIPKILATYNFISDELISRISDILMRDNEKSLFLYDILPQIFCSICSLPYERINPLLQSFFTKYHQILSHNPSSCIRCISSLASRLVNSVDPVLASALSQCIQLIDLQKLSATEWWSLLEAIFLILRMKQHVDLKTLETIARACWDLGYHKLMIMAHMLTIKDDEELPIIVGVLCREIKRELRGDEEEYAAQIFRQINHYLVKTQCSSAPKILKTEYIQEMVKFSYQMNENDYVVKFIHNLLKKSTHHCFLVVNTILEASISNNTWLFCQLTINNEKFAQFFISYSTKNRYTNLIKYLVDCESFIFLTKLILFVFEISKTQQTEKMFEYLKNQGYQEHLSKYEDIMEPQMTEKIMDVYKYFSGTDKMEEV